jgi:hypothetical protein
MARPLGDLVFMWITGTEYLMKQSVTLYSNYLTVFRIRIGFLWIQNPGKNLNADSDLNHRKMLRIPHILSSCA